jgi:hypothetical protein
MIFYARLLPPIQEKSPENLILDESDTGFSVIPAG